MSFHADADTARILDVGDSWAFFPYALQSPPALEQVLSREEFGLGEYLEDGSIGLTNIFAYGWDTDEQKERIAERLNALPTLDICHVTMGGNDFVHGWKQFMTDTQEEALLDEITGHIRNVVQFCLDQRPDIRVAIVGYDYVNLFDGFMINAYNEVWDYESITHWAVTYWGYPIPRTKAEVLEIVAEVHEVWVDLEQHKMLLAQEFGDRVTYIHNFGYVQHVYGVATAGVAPGVVGIPDGPENGYANFPNGRPDLYNPREVMKIEDGEMDPLHLSNEGFLAFMENVVRQCYAAWLTDSTPPTVVDIRPLTGADNPSDAAEVVFEVKFSEAVTGVDTTDFAVRTSDSITGATVTEVSGSGSSYLVSVGGYAGAGTVALDLIDDDTIYDAVWYPLDRLDDGSFQTGRPYWIGGGLLACSSFSTLMTQGEALYGTVLGETWTTADLDGNGIADRFELALAGRLICDTNYAYQVELAQALAAIYTTLETETSCASWAAQADAVAALSAMSTGLRDAMISALGLTQAYSPFETGDEEPLSAVGDPDADARSNLIEYDWVRDQSGGPVEYAIAAATAGCGPDEAPACADPGVYDEQAADFFVALDQGVEWESADWGDDGIPDRFELALLSRVFCDGNHALRDPLLVAQRDNVAALEGDPAAASLLPYSGFLALFAAMNQVTADQMAGDLTLAAALTGLNYGGEEPFDPLADLDGDGASNYREFIWTFIRGGAPEVYAEEATDPALQPNAAIPNCDVAVTFETQGRDFYEFAFATGAWQTADADSSGIPDRYEISVLAAILCDTTHPVHDAAASVYEANLAALQAETGIPYLSGVLDIMAALATLNQTFASVLKAGLSLQNDYYAMTSGTDEPLSFLGDLDLDGIINLMEYTNVGGLSATEPEYVRAVLGSYYPPAPELTVQPMITNDSRPRITGMVHYAVSLELSLDGAVWNTVDVDESTWTYAVPDVLPDGAYDVRVRATGAYSREGQDGTTDELIIDTVAPVITLIGDDHMIAEAAEPYVDPGATAEDDREGDLTGQMDIANSVNTSLIDSFVVTFTVSDAAGNAAMPASRVVEVRDRTAPVIVLAGDAEMTIEAAEPFTDPGATASDTFSGDLTAAIQVTGTVDTDTSGDYTLYYDVRDANRNDAATVSRVVHVVDTRPPVLTLVGDAELTIPALESFVDPGAGATDAVDGVVNVLVEGAVNTGVVGDYTLTYSAQDAAGNATVPVLRLVHVVDTGDPEITVLGENPLTHEAATEYDDPGATAEDAYDGDLTAELETENHVDAAHLGDYTVTYSVADSSGNTDEETRTVHVVDTTAPTVTLLGDPALMHEAPTPYTDAGATALDTVDGDLTDAIQIENGVDVNTLGTYEIVYTAVDAAQNEGTAKRTVHVVDTTAPVITLLGETSVTHEAGEAYTDAGATAEDTYEGDLSSAVQVESTLDEDTPGAYTITYRVMDTSGNEAVPMVRSIEVVDTTAPVITLLGEASVTHEAGEVYTDAGVTAEDSREGDLSSAVQVESTLDEDTPGAYTITYRVSDTSGNEAAPVFRYIEVVDTTPPVLTLLGDADITLRCFDSFTDPGASALDIVDGDRTAAIEVDGAVTEHAPGVYTLIYRVSDSRGNAAAPVTRTVTIVNDCANTADQDGDFKICLIELLRVIQFYNTHAYHCALSTEDGYAPGTGDTWCPTHDADFAPADWNIELIELLRIIQFYNSHGCYPCPDSGTDDGFCVSPP